MQTGMMKINSGSIHYEMAGEGETMVLLHAGIVDSGMWDSQWEAFTQQYRVLRFDMCGYGKSSPVEVPVCRRDDLHAVLQHFNIEKVHLVGCSLGGEVILDYALEHPDKVLSLTVVSATPGGFEMQGEPPQELLEMFGALQSGDVDRAVELQVLVSVVGPFRQPEQVSRAVQEHVAQMNKIPAAQNTFAISDMQPANPLTPPAVTRLDGIHAPALIIAGALDHPELIRAAEVMQANIPNAQKLIMADAAHMLNMEQPAAFNRAVMEFLSALK